MGQSSNKNMRLLNGQNIKKRKENEAQYKNLVFPF